MELGFDAYVFRVNKQLLFPFVGGREDFVRMVIETSKMRPFVFGLTSDLPPCAYSTVQEAVSVRIAALTDEDEELDALSVLDAKSSLI